MDISNSSSNLIQIIEIFLKNLEKFHVLLNNKIGEISSFFDFEINKLNEECFNFVDFSTIRNKKLLKRGINKELIINKIKNSSKMNNIKNNRQLLVQSYHKSLKLAKLLEIYSNLCINIFIKNYSYEDVLHAKTNIIMKEIYDKISVEKKILIT
ncbi:MAG: hypothetical protein ACTSRG_22435 [Candidatus Helarchaeota archaeon]